MTFESLALNGHKEKYLLYIYKPDPDMYDALYLKDSRHWERFERFNGEPLAATWEPVEVEFHRGRKRSDFPFLASHVPVFSCGAWEALKNLLGSAVEALELLGSSDLLAINVLEVIDVLDTERSEIFYFPSGGISSIDRYVFRTEVDIDTPMFKVLGAELKDVLVSESFKQTVAAEGLKGLGTEAIPAG